MPPGQKKYFEDFAPEFEYKYSVPGLTNSEIKKFALQYDPQRFHLDEDEAARTHFGKLVASGFQTQLHCFRPFCKDILLNSYSVGAPGIDSLKWHRPWYPGETLEVVVNLQSKRLSSKRKDRGYLNFVMQAVVNDVLTLTMAWAVIMLVRDGSKD